MEIGAFLTPRGAVRYKRLRNTGLGVCEDHKSKELYPFTPFIDEFGVFPVVPNDTLGFRGDFLDF
jgi:hypothetical protein